MGKTHRRRQSLCCFAARLAAYGSLIKTGFLYGLAMSLALHFVFILALMACVARGLPPSSTTKPTAIERPSLRKSQPTIGEPTASRWPSLAEVITNAGAAIKPSASLLDMLQSHKKQDEFSSDQSVTVASTQPIIDEVSKIPRATVIDVAELGITHDFGLWNEDNIKLDFITGRPCFQYLVLTFSKKKKALVRIDTGVCPISYEIRSTGCITTTRFSAGKIAESQTFCQKCE